MDEKLIEVIERIKYLARDVNADGFLDKETSAQISRICEDALIEWKVEKRLEEPEEIVCKLCGYTWKVEE